MAAKDGDELYGDILLDVFSSLSMEDEDELTTSDEVPWCDDVNTIPSPCKRQHRHPNSPVLGFEPETGEFHLYGKRPSDCDTDSEYELDLGTEDFFAKGKRPAGCNTPNSVKKWKRDICNCRKQLKFTDTLPEIFEYSGEMSDPEEHLEHSLEELKVSSSPACQPEETTSSEDQLKNPSGLEKLNMPSLSESEPDISANEIIPEVRVRGMKHSADIELSGSAKKLKRDADEGDHKNQLKQKEIRKILADVTKCLVGTLDTENKLPCLMEPRDIDSPCTESQRDENGNTSLIQDNVKNKSNLCCSDCALYYSSINVKKWKTLEGMRKCIDSHQIKDLCIRDHDCYEIVSWDKAVYKNEYSERCPTDFAENLMPFDIERSHEEQTFKGEICNDCKNLGERKIRELTDEVHKHIEGDLNLEAQNQYLFDGKSDDEPFSEESQTIELKNEDDISPACGNTRRSRKHPIDCDDDSYAEYKVRNKKTKHSGVVLETKNGEDIKCEVSTEVDTWSVGMEPTTSNNNLKKAKDSPNLSI